jgi:hypothetical protein
VKVVLQSILENLASIQASNTSGANEEEAEEGEEEQQATPSQAEQIQEVISQLYANL